MKNDNYCTIYIVRHGESIANATDIRGADTELTEKGREQAKEFAKKFNNVHLDAIFSSPMMRAKQTVEMLALDKMLEIVTKEALKERHSGIFNGKKYADIKDEVKRYNELRQKLSYEESKHLPLTEGAETDDQIMSRFITELREIAVGYSGKTVLVSSHFGLMRTLLVHLGYKSFEDMRGYKIMNTAFIKLKADGVDFFVEDVNGLERAKEYHQ